MKFLYRTLWCFPPFFLPPVSSMFCHSCLEGSDWLLIGKNKIWGGSRRILKSGINENK